MRRPIEVVMKYCNFSNPNALPTSIQLLFSRYITEYSELGNDVTPKNCATYRLKLPYLLLAVILILGNGIRINKNKVSFVYSYGNGSFCVFYFNNSIFG